MILINDFILGTKASRATLSKYLGVHENMISNYKTGKHLPSIEVAINALESYGIVLHPFSEESLRFEASKKQYEKEK